MKGRGPGIVEPSLHDVLTLSLLPLKLFARVGKFILAATVNRKPSVRGSSVRRAVFLDRDGVINVFPGPGEFVRSWDAFKFMPSVAEQLRRLRAEGFLLILITNQSGVGRGLMTLGDLTGIHGRMQTELGVDALDAIYYCSHHPDDGCACRKPSPDMIQRACAEHDVDAARSFVVGDSGRDIEMGRAAGCTTILCRENLPVRETMKEQHRPDRMYRTLPEAVDFILDGS
jgi:histidinol-phosphate phosphatase family protein